MKQRLDSPAGDGPRTLDPTRRLIVVAGGCVIAGASFAAAAPSLTHQAIGDTMEIYSTPTSPTNKAPERAFTGDVFVEGYFRRDAPSRLAGATVTFTPGSRTPWKVNPVGQTLVVTSGMGWAQVEGEVVVEIRAGDVIWFSPGQRHWEGATPDQAMTYFAAQEGGVEFGESVGDEDYQKGPPIASLR